MINFDTRLKTAFFNATQRSLLSFNNLVSIVVVTLISYLNAVNLVFSRTSLNSLWKVSPTCPGKESMNFLSNGMYMSRDFHMPRDIYPSRGARMPRQIKTAGQAIPEDGVR